MFHLRTQSGPTADLSELQRLLHIPVLHDTSFLFGSVPQEVMKFVYTPTKTQALGVVISVNPDNNPIRKTWSLLHLALHVRILQRRLARKSGIRLGIYGVYPTVESPFAIYALNARAEDYMNAHVLPPFPSGLSGVLRRMIMQLTRFHPSLGGIILVAQKI